MDKEVLTLKSKAALDCVICDRCCKYRGDIRLTPINVLEISKYLKISIREFIDKYTMELEGEAPEIVIKTVGEDRVCVFNNSNNYKCNVHKFRPIQCVMFPLFPIDVKNDLFINMGTCIKQTNKKTTVNKWLNKDKIYKRNKDIYLKWIKLVEELQFKWNNISNEDKIRIREILFLEYDLKKNFRKQVSLNIDKIVKEYIEGV